LEGRDDVADVRAKIEAWLEANPQVDSEWVQHKQLRELWRDTTPAEPTKAAWKQTLERIDHARKRPAQTPLARPTWIAAGIVAASVLILAGLGFAAFRGYFTAPPDLIVKTPQPAPDEFEVLEVASASDVNILRIEDADTPCVVVGTLPVNGPLEFAVSGEVCISCKCPRVVVRQDPPHCPMVYARVEK
jgi:hypothetical protein